MKSVLLSGCGNIGFRHLQALCAMQVPASITVVEPNLDLHGRIRGQIDAAAETGHEIALASELPNDPRRFDLVVVATTAMQRRAVVEQILARHEVGAMILEKILFQTIGDLDAVGSLLDERNVAAYVNCGRRTFAGYHDLRARLADGAPIDIDVRGRRLGLASNGVHFLDLAEFLNNASVVGLDVGGLRPGSVPGRRADCVEIFGSLTAELANGAKLRVESLDAEPTRIEVVVEGSAGTFRVDELARTIGHDDGDPLPFGSQNVSETPEIYQDALETGRCVLTPYADSARQHRFFLTGVRDHLGLSNAADVACPIS